MARFQYFRIAAITVVIIAGSPVMAQSQAEDHGPDAAKETAPENPPAKPAKPYGGGTPLDVIMNNRFWTDEPEPKDFVRQNRQSADELKFQPTVGSDPEPPKNHTKDEFKTLQSELEEAAMQNTQAANGKKVSGKKKAGPPPTAQKTKTIRASDKTHSADKTN